VLVYFGFPRAHEDDASRAIRAGLDILNSVNRYSEELSARSNLMAAVPLQVRIGVHTGSVVTGDIGHGERVDQLALGSAPNVAARVQAEAAPGELLLTDATYRLIARQLQCVALGEHRLKNLSRPVELYRAIGERDPGDIDALALHATPFVGRERELRRVLDLQSQSSRGNGQTLLITGEAGIGKTRLLFEARRRLEGRIERWYTCRCSALHENSALYPVLGLLDRVLGGKPDEATLRDALERWGLDDAEHLNVLVMLLSSGDRSQTARIASQDASQRTVAIVSDVLQRLSSQGPIVIAFEDVHWADPSTFAVLDALSSAIVHDRILLVITARAPFMSPSESIAHQTRIELGRLSSATSTQMVESWIADRLPAPLVELLVQRTDGVPLFLEELTRTLLDRDGSTDDREQSIPMTLRDSLMARLDRLGPAKVTAQLCALLGRRFDTRLLRHVSQAPESQLADHLARIVDSGLLLRQGRGESAAYVFKHALIQEAAYESLLKCQRPQLHNQVVEAVQRDAAVTQLQPELLARHLEGAERIMEAVGQFRVAAERAFKRWALEESLQLFRRARELLATQPRTPERDQTELELLSAMTEPVRANKSYSSKELAEISERTLELVRSMDDKLQVPVLLNIWGVHCVRGDRDSTEAASHELMRLARKGNDSLQLAAAHFARGCTEVYQGQFTPGIDDLTCAIDLADRHSKFGERAADLEQSWFLARLVRAWAFVLTGLADSARRALHDLLDFARESDASFAFVQTACHLNVVDQWLDSEPRLVLDRAERILTIALTRDMPTWARFVRIHAGWARAMLGDSAGIVQLRTEIDGLGEDEVTRGNSVLTLAQSLLAHERDEEALAAIDEADAFFQRNLSAYAKPEAARLRGLSVARAGDVDAARNWFCESRSLSVRQGNKLSRIKALCDEIELLRDSTEASPLLEDLNALDLSMIEGRDTAPCLRAAALLQRRRLPT
jgi:hypothetical protein